jgi:hypothetical protein
MVPGRLQPKLRKMPKEHLKPILRKNSNGDKKKPVRCIDTGEVYASSTEAADLLSGEGILVCPLRIHSTCRGKQKSAGGLRWEYA